MPGSAITMAANSVDTVYKFTAADAGISQFRMESAESNASLYLWDSIEELANGGSHLAFVDAVEVTEEGSGDGTEGGEGSASGGSSSRYICTKDQNLSNTR